MVERFVGLGLQLQAIACCLFVFVFVVFAALIGRIGVRAGCRGRCGRHRRPRRRPRRLVAVVIGPFSGFGDLPASRESSTWTRVVHEFPDVVITVLEVDLDEVFAVLVDPEVDALSRMIWDVEAGVMILDLRRQDFSHQRGRRGSGPIIPLELRLGRLRCPVDVAGLGWYGSVADRLISVGSRDWGGLVLRRAAVSVVATLILLILIAVVALRHATLAILMLVLSE
jgi:hypothetical protein